MFPALVLALTLSVPANNAVTTTEGVMRQLASLHAAGELDRAIDLGAGYLAGRPADHIVRAAFAVVLLKAGQIERAEREVQTLTEAARADPSIRARVEMIEGLRAELHRQEQLATAMADRLRALDRAGAHEAVERLGGALWSKALLHAQIDTYAGDFQGARTRFSHLNPVDDTERRARDQLLTEVDRSEREMARLGELWLNLLFTPMQRTFNPVVIERELAGGDLTPSQREMSRRFFTAPFENWSGEARLKAWMQITADLLALAPLSPAALEAAFSTAVALEDFDGLKALGDHILASAGRLEVKLVGALELGSLVIDARARTISVVVEERWPASVGATKEHRPLQPFMLSFGQVTKLRQEAKCGPTRRGDRNCFNVVALRLGPGASSGRPMLLQELAASFGELAARRSLRNLGRYVGDIVGLRPDRIDLVSEKASTGPGVLTALFTGGIAGLHAAAGRTALATSFVRSYQAMVEDGRRTDRVLQAEHHRWESFAADRVVARCRETAFAYVEDALGLTVSTETSPAAR